MAALFIFIAGFAFAANSGMKAPKYLYHAGQQEQLQQDQGNIPKEIWDEVIMGEGTRFRLPKFRRGLYGGSNIDSISHYSARFVGENHPWIMTIELTEECRMAAANLLENPRFLAWTLEHLQQILASNAGCLNIDTTNCYDLFNPTYYFSSGGKCENLLAQSLEQLNLKVLRDTANRDSWYIRDRDCIKNIEAGAENVLEALATATLKRGASGNCVGREFFEGKTRSA